MNKFLVFLAEGFEEIEALTPVDFLRRAGVDVDTVSITDKKQVVGSHGIPVVADKILDEINADDYLGLYIPGGLPGATNLRDDERVVELVRRLNEAGKIVSAICAGPVVLDKAGALKEKRVTSYPGFHKKMDQFGSYVEDDIVVVDGNVITGRGPAISMYQAYKILEAIKGKEAVDQLKEEVQQYKVEKKYGFSTK